MCNCPECNMSEEAQHYWEEKYEKWLKEQKEESQ
jgi:hypothetical protein